MTDEAEATESQQEQEQAAPAPVEESESDAIRRELSADDDTPAPAPAPAQEETADAAEKPAAEGDAEVDTSVAEAAAQGFEMTEDELAKLINDIVSETEKAQVSKAEKARRVADLNEAIKVAEEEEDFTALGKMALQTYKEQQKAEAQASEASKFLDAGRASAYDELDEVVEEVYGDVLDALTPEELAALDRNKYSSDKEHMTAVFKQLDSKRGGMIRSSVASEQEQQAEATSAAAAAARAQAGGIGVLPGGTGQQTLSDDIGALLRQGLSSGEDVESD